MQKLRASSTRTPMAHSLGTTKAPVQPISGHTFSALMADYWALPVNQGGLGNAVSPALLTLWSQIGDAYSAAITLRRDNPTTQQPFKVIQCPTGSGKSQGLCLYAAETALSNLREPNADPIGILIVVRLITQADEVAATVNRLAGEDCAIASHSENPCTWGDVKKYPVLVITHSAYTNAIRKVGSKVETRYDDFLIWSPSEAYEGRAYRRDLVVVDEALANVVEMAELSLTGIGKIITAFETYPKHERANATALDTLEGMRAILKAFSREVDATGAVAIPKRPVPDLVDFEGAIEALDKMNLAWVFLKKKSEEDHKRIKSQLTQTFRAAEVMLKRWHYLSSEGNKQAFNSASFLIPEGLNDGAVFLDATAENSFLWELLKSRSVEMLKPALKVRDYSTAKLRVCFTRSGLGKTSFSRLGKKRVARLLDFIKANYKAGEKVFIATHRDTEVLFLPYLQTTTDDHEGTISRHFLQCAKGRIEIGLGHYGAIDGRNDWADFEHCIVFGLPYLPQSWSLNVIFALTGFNRELIDRHTSEEVRAYPRLIARRQMATSLIQTTQRIRTRRVVNELGQCLPATITVFLPQAPKSDDPESMSAELAVTDSDGQFWLQALVDELPGISVEQFDYELDGAQVSLRKHGGPYAVLALLQHRGPGDIKLSTIQRELGLSKRSVESVRTLLNDHNSDFSKSIAKLGITFVKGAGGRGNTGKFVKTS